MTPCKATGGPHLISRCDYGFEHDTCGCKQARGPVDVAYVRCPTPDRCRSESTTPVLNPALTGKPDHVGAVIIAADLVAERGPTDVGMRNLVEHLDVATLKAAANLAEHTAVALRYQLSHVRRREAGELGKAQHQ